MNAKIKNTIYNIQLFFPESSSEIFFRGIDPELFYAIL